jgi:RNA polymerase sigma factor for flagellar operon FliA
VSNDANEQGPWWQQYKQSGDLKARDALIRGNVHLVKYVIGRILARYQLDRDAVSVEDLFSCGVLGLMEAVDGFDLSRDVKFVTYAIPRIRGAIIDELRAMDWIPRSLRHRVNRLQAALGELEREQGRPASDSDLAERLDLDPAQLQDLLQQASRITVLSLDEQIQLGEDGQVSREAIAASVGESVRARIHRDEVVALLESAIRELPEKERLVLVMYYVEELTLKEIGKVLNVTESRVCQLHSKAVMRLRGRLRTVEHDMAVE